MSGTTEACIEQVVLTLKTSSGRVSVDVANVLHLAVLGAVRAAATKDVSKNKGQTGSREEVYQQGNLHDYLQSDLVAKVSSDQAMSEAVMGLLCLNHASSEQASKRPLSTEAPEHVARKRARIISNPTAVFRVSSTSPDGSLEKESDNVQSTFIEELDDDHKATEAGNSTRYGVPSDESKEECQQPVDEVVAQSVGDLPWGREAASIALVDVKDLPVMLENSLVKELQSISKGKFYPDSHDRMYSYVYKQSGAKVNGVRPFRGYFVQVPNAPRIASVKSPRIGGLLATACLLDDRLLLKNSAKMWLNWMINNGETAVKQWLTEVTLGKMKRFGTSVISN